MKPLRWSILAVLLVTACGAIPEQSSSTPLPLPSPPTAALARWADFPANAHPRPIILFEPAVERIGPSGFTYDPDRKVAWGCNKFVFADGVKLSAEAPALATAAGASYPAIGSARAYNDLTSARRPESIGPECATYKPFVVKAVRWGTEGFFTDRGWKQMSAWVFDIAEADAHLAYAALDPAALWGHGQVNEGRGAQVSADGRTLRIGVGNAEPGPCGSDYTASAAESNSAVAVAVKQIPHAPPGQPVACDLVLRVSYINLTLKAPLGGRALLDETGAVGAVCPETGDC